MQELFKYTLFFIKVSHDAHSGGECSAQHMKYNVTRSSSDPAALSFDAKLYMAGEVIIKWAIMDIG